MLGEAKVLAYFVERGVEVFLPYSDNCHYDLVVYEDGQLKTVSVKYTSASNRSGTSWCVTLTNTSRRNEGLVTSPYDTAIDILAIYIHPEDRVVLVRDCVNRTGINIRKLEERQLVTQPPC